MTRAATSLVVALLLVGCGAGGPFARWTDADADGVVDARDRCPDAPEDDDDFEDGDGCLDPDNDGDGVLDDVDDCPLDPEDADGFDDEDGCPDPDNDGDGIIDSRDTCPDAPESVNGHLDGDGCPDEPVDRDGDGLFDHLDRCPLDPEDVDGFRDEDGCPDPDHDGDGIPDATDRCPREPEDFDGVEDDDGCPEREPRARYCRPMSERRFAIHERIYFTDGARIPDAARPLLRELGELMRAMPRVRVVVEGHTDDQGSAAGNLALSRRRAQAVYDALIGLGAAPGQLAIRAHGEMNPLDDNRTAAGRAANRRVEFIAVRGPCTVYDGADVTGGALFDADGDGRIDPL